MIFPVSKLFTTKQLTTKLSQKIHGCFGLRIKFSVNYAEKKVLPKVLSKLRLCMYVCKVVASNSKIEFIPARAIRLPDNINKKVCMKVLDISAAWFYV